MTSAAASPVSAAVTSSVPGSVASRDPGTPTSPGSLRGLAQRARAATNAAAAALFAKARTKPWGGRAGLGLHWCAELEGDSILSSEYILMKFILEQEGEASEWARLRRIANQLRLSQRDDGTWGQYPGSPADLSSCVKAYFSLKLIGDAISLPHMARARAAILAMGGAEKINTFSMFYLACLGQVSWEACPAIPPQIVLLPRWFPFHLDKVAAWTRTMILPLALCSALQPVRRLPSEFHIDELFVDKSKREQLSKARDDGKGLTWNNFFLWVDSVLKSCRRAGFTPLRALSLKRSEAWIRERMDPETTEGLGAIFPPMVYVQIAFRALGYERSDPLIRQAEADLDAFMIDEPNPDPKLDHIRLQPCFSPVWDTAIALDALTEAGATAAGDERVARVCDWLQDREVKRVGDWFNNLRPEHKRLRPGQDMACWAFEYRNDWYPDVDDTCMVAKALARAGDRANSTRNRDTAARAVSWVLAMQNDDGGWAAFDRTKNRDWMEAIPFADHNAMQDPSCSDITGRVTESLITSGVPHTHEAIRRALDYLVRTQQAAPGAAGGAGAAGGVGGAGGVSANDAGCWWGRWGVNYIYGTWQAVNGLVYGSGLLPPTSSGAGYRPDEGLAKCEPAVRRALERARAWLLSIQNDDGGFGESANSYLDRSLMGRGPSTASQTAWALITLMHLVPIEHESIARAVRWLLDDQLVSEKTPFEAARHAGKAPTTSSSPLLSPACRSDDATMRNDVSGYTGSSARGHDGCRPEVDHIHDLAGGFCEHFFTGTGFPKVFYLRYHLYRHSFPLKALARFAARAGA